MLEIDSGTARRGSALTDLELREFETTAGSISGLRETSMVQEGVTHMQPYPPPPYANLRQTVKLHHHTAGRHPCSLVRVYARYPCFLHGARQRAEPALWLPDQHVFAPNRFVGVARSEVCEHHGAFGNHDLRNQGAVDPAYGLGYGEDSIPLRSERCRVRTYRKMTAVVLDRKSTRLNSSHSGESRMPSSA